MNSSWFPKPGVSTRPRTVQSEQTDPSASPISGITGLYSDALLDPLNMYVAAMRSAVERGDLDEMSFAFRVIRQEWNDDYTRRWINEVSLNKGDVSLVNYAASPATGGTVALRQRLLGRSERPRAAGGSSAAALAVPDHVSRAKLDLARAGNGKRRPKTAHAMWVADLRAGRLRDPSAVSARHIVEAREQLAARKRKRP